MMSSGLVSWASKLQNNIALSTVEAKYMALSVSSQEVTFLRQLLPTFGFLIAGPIIAYEDNDNYISFAPPTI